jgi:hypothetical protein
MTRICRGAKSAASKHRSMPQAMEGHYQSVIGLTDDFCHRRLNEEYAELARRAVAALCRKRPSPLLSGQAASWACGILYALGRANFLSDRSSTPSMSMQELCAGFGVAPSTGGNKAKTVRDALGISPWDHRWLLRAKVASMPMVWLLALDGFTVDARGLPRPLQIAAHERGLIPYVPADGPAGDGGARDAILTRYDRYRAVATRQQTLLAKRLWTEAVVPMALRLGLIGAEGDANGRTADDLAAAADLALYSTDPDGMSAVSRYVAGNSGGVTDLERPVLDGMCAAVFSIFRVEGGHCGAGVDLIDLVSGDRFWIVDRGLEATAYAGTEVAMRLFRPDDFWMSTGVAMVMDEVIWRELEKTNLIRRRAPRAQSSDRDALAEAIYRLAAE